MVLEFSEEQQAFHLNTGDYEENSNSYKTLGVVSEDNLFTTYFRRGYPGTDYTFDFVKKEFDIFQSI
jgi:hypothetical protein